MPPVVIQLVALLDLLFVLTGVVFSLLLTFRRGNPAGPGGDAQANGLRRMRRLAFQVATAGFILTLVLIMVDLLIRSSQDG